MRIKNIVAVAAVGLIVMAQGVRAESVHRIGVAANYWTMLEDIDLDNVDESGLSWMASYQYKPVALFKIEADLEVFPKGFQGIDDNAFAPQAYLIIGSGLYAGVGAGILYADGDFADKPFYALRAGVELELLPKLYLDLNVIYRFQEWANLSTMKEDINEDTLMLGAALRLEF